MNGNTYCGRTTGKDTRHTAHANKDHGVNHSSKQSCSDGPSGFLIASIYLVAQLHYPDGGTGLHGQRHALHRPSPHPCTSCLFGGDLGPSSVDEFEDDRPVHELAETLQNRLSDSMARPHHIVRLRSPVVHRGVGLCSLIDYHAARICRLDHQLSRRWSNGENK